MLVVSSSLLSSQFDHGLAHVLLVRVVVSLVDPIIPSLMPAETDDLIALTVEFRKVWKRQLDST
jgi:hypothetical protein